MKVLWIDLVAEMGGAQHSMLEVCAALPAAGVEVVAAVPYGPLFDRLTAAGLQVFPLSPLRATRRGWGFFTTAAKLLQTPGSLAQIVHAVKPQILHANSLPAFIAAARSGAHAPLVWHVRDLRLPVVVAHEAAKRADRIIAASDAIDEYLVDILSPRTLGRIRVVRNGIDIERFRTGDKAAARLRLGLPPDVPVVGMVAHLVPWKRHDAFIDAAAAICRFRSDVHFVAVGRDLFKEHARWSAQLEARVRAAGLSERFHWIKDADACHDLLPAFDLLLHPALNEPFGRVICEAMAAHVPVIAADSAGPASIIEANVSGLLVPEGDPQRMADAALDLLASPERARSLADEGMRRVRSRFTTGHVCAQLAKEYASLLASLDAGSENDD